MIILYFLLLLGLGVYSYSQIDLNLTLLQTPWFLEFQKVMIQLGYFNRPLSTLIFLIIILLLFAFYILFLREKKVSIIKLAIGISLLGLFSYPVFSHDFFNYLFDARIVTFYHQNPYFFRPLDFPDDLWLRFMHWTHRTYPYGPAWLLLTIPASYFGFGKFLLTVINFKFLFIAFYLGSIILIKKIAGKRSAVFFAANPLIIIESLVSPHLDSAMSFFFLLGVYLFIVQKKLFALGALLFSGGVKFLTLITLPLFFRLPLKKLLWFSLILLLIGLTPVIWQREIYPWYFLPAMTIASLLIENKKVLIFSLALSFGLLLRYAPFLYLGKESLPPENILTFFPILLCALGFIFYRRR